MVVFIAILSGLVSSYCLTTVRFRQLMVIIYHLPFRFWRPYVELYDAFESWYTYELLGGKKRFKSHKAFLNEYRDKRSFVTELFRSLWGVYAKQVGHDYGLVIIVALGLFWNFFWAFTIPFLVVHLVILLRFYLGKNYRADFFAIAVISVLLPDRI